MNLERQAEAARKYQLLKAEERQKKAQLMALKWQTLDADFQQREGAIRELEVTIEGRLAEQTACGAKTETVRLEVMGYNDTFQHAQEVFYELGSRIARQEQKLEHQIQLSRQLGENRVQIEQAITTNQHALNKDELAIAEARDQLLFVDEELAMLTLQQEEQAEQVHIAEEQWNAWQDSWHHFTEKAGAPARQSDVCKTRIQALQQQLASQQNVLERRQQEQADLQRQTADDELAMLEGEIAEQELLQDTGLEQEIRAKEALSQTRQQLSDGRAALESDRQRLNQLVQRKVTLEALQKAALGDDNQAGIHWLESHQLSRHPRLSQTLQVTDGWEIAVETVLGERLNAVMVDNLDALLAQVEQADGLDLSFWQSYRQSSLSHSDFPQHADALSSKVHTSTNMDSLLASVRTAASLSDALALRSGLSTHESIILPDGTWVGPDWLQLPGSLDEDGSLLQRQQELELVTEEWDLLDMEVEEKAVDLDGLQLRIQGQEHTLEQMTERLKLCQSRLSELNIKAAGLRAQREQRTRRLNETAEEVSEIQEQRALLLEELETARMEEQEALSMLAAFASERDELQSQRDILQRALEDARQGQQGAQQQCHQQQLTQQQLRSQLDGLETAKSRLLQEQDTLNQRYQALLESQGKDHQQEQEQIQADLQRLLEQRQDAEQRMTQERQQLEQAEALQQELDDQRQQLEQQLQELRGRLETARLECQALNIRQQTLIEQLSEEGLTLKEVVECLSSDASVEQWQTDLSNIGEKIRRLGAINLAAIDEFQQQQERKQYLDAQHQDLLTALETLEGAIVRIDKETRSRFRETFETINRGLSELFPKVFGGGNAWLELTGDDLLTTGVAIMARPPGKKNSTIHLLSGGEKALTAIALVFSIFQLNPAPFCMLDEVDAPLDDANVGRYGRLVKAMSDRVQFIYITHNKIAMEMASDLLGVTMQEPGVSRLVSVSVDQAADMMD